MDFDNELKWPRLWMLCFLAPSFSQALELNANFYSESEYTSNAKLETTDTIDDVIEKVGVSILLTEKRKRFNADARFELSQEYYLKNTFDNETQLTTGFGLFNFDIVEEFLDWRTSFTRNDVLIDSIESETPDNREQRNTFRTGPAINYRINQMSVFRFGSNYVQVENSDIDSADTKRIEANASYIYQYNSITDFSLNADYDRVIQTKEREQTFSNSDEQPKTINLNVGVNRKFSHGSFAINYGRNEVRQEKNDTISGNYFSVIFSREQVFSHNLKVNYSQSISDSSIGFDSFEQSLVENPDLDLSNTQLETTSQLDIIKREQLEIALNRRIGSYQYKVASLWTDLNYEQQLKDERTLSLDLNLKHHIREGMVAGFSYRQVNQKFLDDIKEGNRITRTYSIDGSFHWTKNFSVNSVVSYEKRGNNKNAVREYEDFSVGLTFKYDIY